MGSLGSTFARHGEAWRLYKRLFARSVVLGAIVFGVLGLIELLGRSGQAAAAVGLLSLAFTIGGVALLQGGLVEIVRGLHADGDDEPGASELLGRAGGQLWKLVCVSLLPEPGDRAGAFWAEQEARFDEREGRPRS